MKNPTAFCPHCQKMHGNPVIELFNTFTSHAFSQGMSEAQEMDIYRTYCSGQHDALSIILKMADYPQDAAERMLNDYACAVRDAVVAGIDPANEELRAKVAKAIAVRFALKERGCSKGRFDGN